VDCCSLEVDPGQLTNVSVVAATTDYAVTPPADFLYLNQALLTDGSQTNYPKVVSSLPSACVQVGNPNEVATWMPLT